MRSYALAMWYGSTRVIDGDYNGGQTLIVLFSALIGGMALGQGMPNLQYFQQGQVAAARLYSILDRPSQINADDPGQEPKSVEGQLELRDVVFAYPSRPEKPVFNGFSLTVPAGKTVALVGESGSGKSTVVQLIERFYDPHRGVVLLDGRLIENLHVEQAQRQVALAAMIAGGGDPPA